jgi:hypothetical protein
MTEPTEQRYGWWSEQHEQALPGSASVWQTPDGQYVFITRVNDSSADPGGYKWPDAYCVGPVTKCVRISDRAKKIFQKQNIDYLRQ